MIYKSREYQGIFGIFAIIVILIIAMFLLFFSVIKDRLDGTTASFFIQVAEQDAARIDQMLEGHFDSLQALANIIESETFNIENVIRTINNSAVTGKYAGVGVILTDGTGYFIDEPTKNYKSQPFFEQAMAESRYFSEPLKLEGRSYKVHASSVQIKKNNKVVGILVALIDNEKLRKITDEFTYKGHMYTFIINTDGKLIVMSNHKNALLKEERNYFDFISEYKTNKDVTNIRNKIMEGDTGTFEYKIGESSRYAYFAPIGLRSGWYIVSAIPTEVATEDRTFVLEITIILFIVVTILLVVLFFINYHHQKILDREIQIANEAELENSKKLEISKETQKAKEEFFDKISLEIRTPIIAIIGVIEFLKKTKLDERQKNYTEKIEEATGILSGLLEKILDQKHQKK